MLVAAAVIVTLMILAYTLLVRSKDVPVDAPPPPYQHLEGRKAAIYENLRDLQFEYRVGKLSDEDYQRTKKELQAELSTVLAEIDRLKAAPAPVNGAEPPRKAAPAATVCPHCKAEFDKPLRFCGECGKSMSVTA